MAAPARGLWASWTKCRLYDRALAAGEIQAIYNAGSAGKCLTSVPPACAPPSADLVSWWAAEGNALDSADSNNGTLQGATTFAPGMVGQAFNFNPASGTVIVPDSPSLRLTSQLTIEGWINTRANTDPGGYAIVSKLSFDTGLNGYQFLVVGNTLQGLFNSPGTSWPSQRIISGPIISTGVWYHVAFIYDQSSMKLYCNGQLVTNQVIGAHAIATSSSDLHISGVDSDHTYFDGLIDEVSIYGRALSDAEIAAIYNAGSAGKCPSGVAPSINAQPASQTVLAGSNVTFRVTAAGTAPLSYQWQFSGTNLAGATGTSLTLSNVQPAQAGSYAVLVTNAFGSITSSNALLTVNSLTNGLTAYYPFNGNANDASGNGNNGVVNGATLTADRFGSPNSAYRFNGTSWIQLPDTVEPAQPSGLTLSAWVQADSGANAAGAWLIHLSNRTGEGGMAIWNAGSWGAWVKLQDSYSPGYYANQDTAIPSAWTHIVAVYTQGQFVEFWVNGSLIQSNTVPNYPLYTDPYFPLNSSIGNYDYAPGASTTVSLGQWMTFAFTIALCPPAKSRPFISMKQPLPTIRLSPNNPKARRSLAGSNVTFTATATAERR